MTFELHARESDAESAISYQFGSVAAPQVGRSLGGLVASATPPIRRAVSILANRACPADAELLLSNSTVMGPGGVIEPSAIRFAWMLVCAALLFARSNRKSRTDSLRASIAWFTGDISFANVVARKYGSEFKAAEKELAAAVLNEDFWPLLPYVLEPDGHVTRSDYENCQASRERKGRKRSSGAFYTPGDVAQFMVASIFNKQCAWLDPACGTGVFLRAVLIHARRKHPDIDLTEFAKTRLFGIDLSALATDLAATVLLEQILSSHSNTAPIAAWRMLKRNLACADAFQVAPPGDSTVDLFDCGSTTRLPDLFGERFAAGFDRVIMNPPYTSTEIRRSLSGRWAVVHPDASRADTQIVFTEMMWRFTTTRGASVAVLPLSIGTNTTANYVRLRSEMSRVLARKTFLFFDREPQALFGEDIKTRNVICVLDKSADVSATSTSGLLKWSAHQRPSIFTMARATPLGAADVSRFVPKVSSLTEAELYFKLTNNGGESVGRVAITRARYAELTNSGDSTDLYVSTTAYNFLNVFKSDGLPCSPNLTLSTSPLLKLSLKNDSYCFAALAVIASRLMFWLWHVECDGFHVSSEFLARSPLWRALARAETKQKLAVEGERYWKDALKFRLQSTNGGRATFSFHSGYSTAFYQKIDGLILDGLGLTYPVEFLDQFIDSTVHVGGVRRDRQQA